MESGIEPLPGADAGGPPQGSLPGEHTPELHWGRLVWTAEFLLALMAGMMAWSEIGGQVHLDMMPWYLKLLPLVAFAWAVVRFTMAIVRQSEPLRGRALAWLSAIVLAAAVMGAITWYYHMHEPLDDSDEDQGLSTSIGSPGSMFFGG